MNRKNSIFFLISLIAFITIFAVAISRSEFKNDNSVEESIKRDVLQGKLANSTGYAAGVSNDKKQSSEQSSQIPKSSPSDPSQPAPGENDPSSSPENNPPEENNGANPDKRNFQSDKLKISFDYTGDLKMTESGDYLTIEKGNKSWKMKFYDDKKKDSIESWFKSHFDKKQNDGCTFEPGTVTVGELESKSISLGLDSGKCEDGGNFAINSEKTRIVRVDIGSETTNEINDILSSFKFLN